jgi:preprotein translocase subunit YajC
MQSFGGLLFPLLILLLFIPIFLSGRKQRRQMANMQQLQSSLRPGDVVTTTSGLRGTVVDASYEDTVDLEIADGVITTWLRAAVREKVLDSGAAGAEPEAESGPAPSVGSDGASLTGPAAPPTVPPVVKPAPPARADAPDAPLGDTFSDPTSDANGTAGPRP